MEEEEEEEEEEQEEGRRQETHMHFRKCGASPPEEEEQEKVEAALEAALGAVGADSKSGPIVKVLIIHPLVAIRSHSCDMKEREGGGFSFNPPPLLLSKRITDDG